MCGACSRGCLEETLGSNIVQLSSLRSSGRLLSIDTHLRVYERWKKQWDGSRTSGTKNFLQTPSRGPQSRLQGPENGKLHKVMQFESITSTQSDSKRLRVPRLHGQDFREFRKPRFVRQGLKCVKIADQSCYDQDHHTSGNHAKRRVPTKSPGWPPVLLDGHPDHCPRRRSEWFGQAIGGRSGPRA